MIKRLVYFLLLSVIFSPFALAKKSKLKPTAISKYKSTRNIKIPSYKEEIVENIDQYDELLSRDNLTSLRVIPAAGLALGRSVDSGTFFANQQSIVSSRLGFSGGVFVDYGKRNLVLETGVLFQQTGLTNEGLTCRNFSIQCGVSAQGFGSSFLAGFPREKLAFNYISVPLAVKYHLSSQSRSSVFVKGGLLPSFLISVQSTLEDDFFQSTVSAPKQRFQSFDLMGTVAVGAHIRVAKTMSFFIEGSYFRGFINVLPSTPIQTINTIGFQEDLFNQGGLAMTGLVIELN